MKKIIVLGRCPDRLVVKARKILNDRHQLSIRARKTNRSRQWCSVRLNMRFRLLISEHYLAYIANHDRYERMINKLK